MISQIYIERPKLAMVISIVSVLLGLLCMRTAPIAEYPDIAPPCVNVLATYTGAGSEEVANTVASVIEEQMNGLEDLLYFKSTSTNTGTYTLEISFKSGTNTDIAQVNVQNAVRRAEPVLPQNVIDNGIKIFKKSPDVLAVYSFITDGSKLNITQLSNYIRTNIRDPLARIDGISEVVILGERNYSMRLWLNSYKMAGLGIRADEVVEALKSQNVQAAAGSVGVESSNDFLQLKINTLGRLVTEEEFGNIIVRAGSDGRLVKIRDIARVELGAENYFHSATCDNDESIMVMISRNDDANAINTVDSANALLKDLEKTFPQGIKYVISYDPTEFIRISMREIFETLLETLILVVAITYIFLQDWRATLIPSITIPVSLISTFIFLIPLGFSINLLTMFALILVIGSLVDDAIVVTENCMRIIEEEGLPPKEAASKSMHQITGAVIATTLVIVAIYAPVGFYGGMVGTIYLQFAVTMCISLCLSTVNALTLSPALCGLLLRQKQPIKFLPFVWFNRALVWSRDLYLSCSAFFLRHIWVAVLIFAATLVGSKIFYDRLPRSFIPSEDKGALLCSVDLPPGATLNRTAEAQRKARALLLGTKGVKMMNTISGYSFTSGVGESVGSLIVQLDDWNLRKSPDLEIGAMSMRINEKLAQIPEASINVFQPPAIMGLGVTGGVNFMLTATGKQTSFDLFNDTNALLDKIRKIHGVAQAFTTFEASTPQIYLDIDREKVEAMGLPLSRVFLAMQGKLASIYVNDFNLQGYSFKVKIQADKSERSQIEDILQLQVRNKHDKMVPFSSFCKVRCVVGPRLITRYNQNLASTVNVVCTTGTSTSVVMNEIEKIKEATLSKDYIINWTDMSYQERSNEGKIVVLLIFAVLFGYLFLVGQYESWTIPAPVIASFFVAMFGGFLGLWMCNMSFSIYAQLGIVMLIGLTCKNAILMVEFSKDQREAGLSINDAAQEGFRQRYRAVLMTAWSFVIGVIPMAIATGAGAGSRRAIGITTLSGMLLATIFGIVLIPASYAMFQRLSECCDSVTTKKSTPAK